MDRIKIKLINVIYKHIQLLWVVFTLVLLLFCYYLTLSSYPLRIQPQIWLGLLILSCLCYWLLQKTFGRQSPLGRVLKKALKNKKFYPVYLPLFDTYTNTFCGAEVLLRWKASKNNIITPDYFIQEAETSGLIIPITLDIAETAFQQTRTILAKNPHFSLSFNLSAAHFRDPDFLNQFNQLMNYYAILPQQILLEITERELIDTHNELYIHKMRVLREKGFSLAVDDYGTGHASISYLHSFPFNYLKIDKLFINAIGTKAITESLNEAIIDLAKKLNLIIIAEGVETQKQVDFLQTKGIQLQQGWYFSKPLSIYQLKRLLKGEN